jgi:hypothetical protein
MTGQFRFEDNVKRQGKKKGDTNMEIKFEVVYR